MRTISSFLSGIQKTLFSVLEEEWGELTECHRKVITTLELVGIDRGINDDYTYGRPVSNRKALARAFVAKMIYNAPFNNHFRERILTDPVLRRICGWTSRDRVPGEPTFPRAFRESKERFGNWRPPRRCAFVNGPEWNG